MMVSQNLFMGIVVFLLTTGTTLWSQQNPNAQVDQQRLLQSQEQQADRRALPTSEGDSAFSDIAPTTPGDEDLGVQQLMKRKDKFNAFNFLGDATIFHTSNAALARFYPQNENFIVYGGAFSYTPKITERLFAEATFRQQWFRYDTLRFLDFDSQMMNGGLTYIVPELCDIAVFGRYGYNRLTYAYKNGDGPIGSEFFNNHTATFGFQKMFPISRAHYWYVGHSSTFGWSDPVSNQRDDYAVFIGYNLKITRALELALNGRLTYQEYNFARGRQDLNQLYGASLTYTPIEYVQITASTSYGINNSDIPTFNYEVNNVGVTLGARYRF